jgi:(+)-trans-carveol dehydrogenase/(-)-trans-carveol dehydrogenase
MGTRVAGKVALITGAARGIGRSNAVRLAEEGADIIALDICRGTADFYQGATDDDLAETGREVEALGRRVVARRTDVRDFDALKAAVDEGVAELGRLDIVSAAAGMGATPYPSHELPEKLWQDMIDVNLTGVWHTTKAAIPHIIDGGRGGSIVIISSVAGFRAFATVGQYVTAKHGLVGLMRSLALELGPHSIRVNTVHPCQVDTDLIQNEPTYRVFRPDLAAPSKDDFREASKKTLVLPIPWIEPIDVSNAVLFLTSDEARYITGATIAVDAGQSVK